MSSFSKANDIINRAVQEEQEGCYVEALRLYEHGIEYLQHTIKYETRSEDKKDDIRAMCLTYVERVERLSEIISSLEDSNGSMTESNENQMENNIIKQSIVRDRESVAWDSIAGLTDAKAFLTSIMESHLGSPRSREKDLPHTALLFGPPGTGKSFLIKAVANAATSATLISLNSADIVSKWLGDSEKLMDSLFMIARRRGPTIIFIDQADWFNRPHSESDALRSIKVALTDHLRMMREKRDNIVVLAETNAPWDMDPDVLHRFDKTLYIPLPDETALIQLFKQNMKNASHCLDEEDFHILGQRAHGFTGADIAVITNESQMQTLHKIQAATHFCQVSGPTPGKEYEFSNDLLTPCNSNDPGALAMSWTEVPSEKMLEPQVSLCDVLSVLSNSRPSVSYHEVKKHNRFAFEICHR